MSDDKISEIKARHEYFHKNFGSYNIEHNDRGLLLAEVERLRAERDHAWETIDRMCRDMNNGTFVYPEILILLVCCVLAGVTWWATS